MMLRAGVLLAAGIVVSVPQRNAAPTPRANVLTMAAGALVLTHSGQYNDQWAALNLVDGDPKTGWSAPDGNKLPADFVIELAQTYTLRALAFDTRSAQEASYAGISARAIEVWASTEGPDRGFTRVLTAEAPKGGRAETPFAAPVAARWLKLVITSNWGNTQYTELMEVEGFGEPAGAAQPRPSAAGVYATNYGAMKLSDAAGTIGGCYDGGSITGAGDGRVLNVEWRSTSDPKRFGGALFVVSSRGDVINGVWYLNGERQGLWYGKRSTAAHQCPAASGSVAASLSQHGRAILYGVRFASDSATLAAESTATLEQVAALLKADSSLTLAIEGHTDSTNTDAYNMDLSARRANAVVAWLTQHGADAARLKAVGYGRTRPIADNATPAGRAINRRVEISKQ